MTIYATVFLAILLLATPARAINVMLCPWPEDEHWPYPEECSTTSPLNLGTFYEGQRIVLMPYLKVDKGEDWTDNTCAFRMALTPTTAYADALWMGFGNQDYDDPDLTLEAVGSQPWILVSQGSDYPLAYNYAGEWYDILGRPFGAIWFEVDSTEPDCVSHTYTLTANTNSGAAMTLTGDPPAWDCGGLEYDNPMPDRTAQDVVNFSPDSEIPLSVQTVYITHVPDEDEDEVANAVDNCVYVYNPDQIDTDEDGYGNRCDGDFDGNGTSGVSDFGALIDAWGCTTGQGCYDEDIDMDSSGGIGVGDWGLFLPGYGYSLAGKGLDLCE
jgi:hypothetical protein